MKLEAAYLCENCDEISETDGHGCCGACGSPALLNLAKILNRDSEEEILNFTPRVSAKFTEDDVVLCVSSARASRTAS